MKSFEEDELSASSKGVESAKNPEAGPQLMQIDANKLLVVNGADDRKSSMTTGKKAKARLSFRKVKKVQVLASDEDEDSIQRVSGSVSGFDSSDKSRHAGSVKLIM
jgi:hypothetical protein